MFPSTFLIIVTLLTSPIDAPVPCDLCPTRELRDAMQIVAVQWEILDPREVRYVLTREEDFEADVRLLRRRYHELLGAPSLSDGNRFPERGAISDMLAFNRAYRQSLDSRLAVELVRWWELQEAVQETDRLYAVWDLVRDARCDYYYVTVRRGALKRLRDMVGPELYYSGNMPPYVPLWRFQVID